LQRLSLKAAAEFATSQEPGCDFAQEFATAQFSLSFRATMLSLTPRRRTMLADKVPDLLNLILASTFLAQFLMDRPFSVVLAIVGFAIWAGFAVLAFVVADND
jgi:hypothetical protein